VIKFGFIVPLLISLFIPCVYSQSVRLGFKIGVRLPDEVATLKRTESFSEFDQGDFYIADESRRIAFGPAIEFRLLTRMSAESGVLYRSIATVGTTHVFQTNPNPGDPFNFNLWFRRRTHAKSIEIPALLRFWLSDKSVRPFVGTGYVYRRFMDSSEELFAGSPFVNFARRASTIHSNHGVVVTGGLEMKARFLRISPEVRYTRWSRRVFDGSPFPTATNLNQVDLFFGIGL